MAIGEIVILFITITITVISGLGIIFLFLIKNETAKKIVFYILSIWGIFISLINITSLPNNDIKNKILCLSIASLSLIGIVIHIKAKNKLLYNIAYIFTIGSIGLGILKLIYF